MDQLYGIKKPDGTTRKLLDSSKIMKFGWRPEIELSEGIKSVYNNYKETL